MCRYGFLDVICKALGRFLDDKSIESVVSSADHAAYAAGAEFQLGIKALVKLDQVVFCQKLLDLAFKNGVLFEHYVVFCFLDYYVSVHF